MSQAAGMLRHLRGRMHDVYTGVAVVSADGAVGGRAHKIWFAPMTDEDISWYVASGEPWTARRRHPGDWPPVYPRIEAPIRTWWGCRWRWSLVS
jgi:hypothetical protein